MSVQRLRSHAPYEGNRTLDAKGPWGSDVPSFSVEGDSEGSVLTQRLDLLPSVEVPIVEGQKIGVSRHAENTSRNWVSNHPSVGKDERGPEGTE